MGDTMNNPANLTNQRQPTVLITNSVPDDILAPLEGIAHVILGPSGGDTMPRAEVLQIAPELDAIINQGELHVDEQLLQAAPNLKIVANVAAGYNNLNLTLMTDYGVWATNTPDAFIDSTADCTLALLLALARQVVHADQYVRSGAWTAFQPGVWDGILLSGKRLGIVGYGRTGRAVAHRARAFGMTILYNRRQQSDDPQYRELDDLLREADFVTLHTPLIPETHHLIDAARLRLMKPGAALINMARGAVVDEAALVAALQSGHLGGAGLDVFEFEPNISLALRQMENVVLTPHMGGGTVESRSSARRLCVQNVCAALQGQRPPTALNELSLSPQ